MKCFKCGAEMIENQYYCSKCGEHMINKNETIVNQEVVVSKKKSLKKFCILAIFILLIILILIKVLTQSFSTISFDIGYNSDEITSFMESICKNVDAEEIEIIDVRESVLDVAIKPYDKTAELITVHFNNYNDSDKVVSMVISFDSNDSENENLCKTLLVEAVEKTFGRKFLAEEYLPRMSEGKTLTMYDDDKILADYQLSGDVFVKIICSDSFDPFGWDGRYVVYKNDLMN